MPVAVLTELLKAKLDDPTHPAVSEWKRNHPDGKAIGCFPIYIPTDMIHAAGMLPVQIAGAMGQLKLDGADAYLQSFVCSVGRSTLELKLDGYLDNLDAFIIPSVCEVSRGLSGVMRRIDPEKPVIYLNYPQNLNSKFSFDYLVGELTRVKSELEKISGSPIADEALLNSFEIYNQRAALLAKLDQYRSDHPEKLKTSEFYVLRLAGMTVTCEEHIAVLKEALKALEDTAPRETPKLRMVFFGAFCERPPVAMLEAIEAEGIAIVSDDILLGQRWWTEPLPTSGNPIEILADHYLKHTVRNPVVYHADAGVCTNLLSVIDERKADSLILSSAKTCHPALHDIHQIFKSCEKHGIPYVRIEFEEDQRVFESIIVQIEALQEARERLPFAGTYQNNSGICNE